MQFWIVCINLSKGYALLLLIKGRKLTVYNREKLPIYLPSTLLCLPASIQPKILSNILLLPNNIHFAFLLSNIISTCAIFFRPFQLVYILPYPAQ
jgi:hypothetical protein